MSQELIYTSVPRGLKPGSKGFCTVAMSAGMPAALIERLESLSGYRAVFPLGSARAADNPINWSHYRLQGTRSLLSRVAFAGVDYSQRSNKFAHHVVLDPREQPAPGPAWVLSQPGFMLADWKSEPQILSAPRPIPAGPPSARPPRPCDAWTYVAGDAGWAGALAASFVESRSKPAYVIYPAGTDVLALFEEALSLLEPSLRWQVTFSTYFTALPVGLDCAWRGVPVESANAKEVLRSSAPRLLIDLTQPLSAPPPSPFVQAAREGAPPPAVTAVPTPRSPEYSLELQPEDPDPSSDPKKPTLRRRLVQVPQEPLELAEEDFGRSNYSLTTPPPIYEARRSRLPAVALTAALAIVLLAGAAATVFVLKSRTRIPKPGAINNPSPAPKPTDEATEVVTALHIEIANVVGDPDGAERKAAEITAEHPRVKNDRAVVRAMQEFKECIEAEQKRHKVFSDALETAEANGVKNPSKADFGSAKVLARTPDEKATVRKAQSKFLRIAEEHNASTEWQRWHEAFNRELRAFKAKIAEYAHKQPAASTAAATPAVPAKPIEVVEIHLPIPAIPQNGFDSVTATARNTRLPAQWSNAVIIFPNDQPRLDCTSGSFTSVWANGQGQDPLALQWRISSNNSKALAATHETKVRSIDMSPAPRQLQLSAATFADANEIATSILAYTRVDISSEGRTYHVFWESPVGATDRTRTISITLGPDFRSKLLPTITTDDLELYARLVPPADNVPQGWHWEQRGTGVVGSLIAHPEYKQYVISLSSTAPVRITENYNDCDQDLKTKEGELKQQLDQANAAKTAADSRKDQKKKDEADRKYQAIRQEHDKASQLFQDFEGEIEEIKAFTIQVQLQNGVPIALIKVEPTATKK